MCYCKELKTDKILSEPQARSRARHSTIDQLFTLRRLSEMYYECSKNVYALCAVLILRKDSMVCGEQQYGVL